MDTYDAGRLALVRVRTDRVVKGAAEGDVTVIVRRDLPSVPDPMTSGDSVLLFAVPAARTSSSAAVLPPGRHLEPAGGRPGVIAGSPADIAEATDVVQRLAAASATPDPDPARRAAARRALVFDELAARHPRLVADGAAALPALPDLAPTLSDGERTRLAAAVARTDLPSWVRVAVVRAIADARLTALAPALRAIPAADGALLDATWTALRRLGAPPSARELERALADPDPSARAAAAAALGASNAPEAAERLGRLALGDGDESVRIAAVEALAHPGLPGALPVLEKVFATGDWPLRQAAGRAIIAVGGRPAQEAFARLAFSEHREAQKYAVTLLMLTGIDRNDALVARIRTTHPDPDVRDLVVHGLPQSHAPHH